MKAMFSCLLAVFFVAVSLSLTGSLAGRGKCLLL